MHIIYDISIMECVLRVLVLLFKYLFINYIDLGPKGWRLLKFMHAHLDGAIFQFHNLA